MELRRVNSEKRIVKNENDGSRLSTIYLGGGTPSQLSAENLHRLFQYIEKKGSEKEWKGSEKEWKGMEITMECNPDDITDAFCDTLRQLPVNRISMGAQTFSDERLRFLRRRHTARQVTEAVERLRNVGIGNISIDLMFGFPNETLSDWEEDITAALSLGVEHISAYSLMYEEGTVLYEQMKNRKLKRRNGEQEATSDELSRQMYERLIDRFDAAGYEHYEISNWARSYRSQHNSNYWNGTPYIGLGAAAHSYNGHTRSWNVSNLQQYIEAIEEGILPAEHELLTDDTRYNDLITTALRTREGILLDSLDEKYRQYLLTNARQNLDLGLLTTETTSAGTRIRLTRQGLFVSDNVMSDLILI